MTNTKRYKKSWGTVVCWGSLKDTATIMVDYKSKSDDFYETYDLVMDCYDPNVHGKTFPALIKWFAKRDVFPVQISSDL